MLGFNHFFVRRKVIDILACFFASYSAFHERGSIFTYARTRRYTLQILNSVSSETMLVFVAMSLKRMSIYWKIVSAYEQWQQLLEILFVSACEQGIIMSFSFYSFRTYCNLLLCPSASVMKSAVTPVVFGLRTKYNHVF